MSGRKRASSPSGGAAAAQGSVRRTSGQDRPSTAAATSDDEIGEWEDRYEDEYESEDIVTEDEEDSDEDDGEDDEGMAGQGQDSLAVRQAGDRVAGMELDGQQEEEEEQETMPYLPQLGQGDKELAEDEELVPDMSSYVLLHHARLAWPCLSFDVLRDNEGSHRLKPPHSACVVAGTQAAETERDANEVVIMKWDNLTKGKDVSNDDSDSDESEAESDDGVQDEDATLVFRSIPHQGGVNRIRAQFLPESNTPPPSPPNPYHVATFSETGKVHIFDIAPHLHSLLHPAEAGALAPTLSKTPQFTINAHGRAEGFALAWGPLLGNSSKRLLSGDIHAKIHLSTLTESGVSTSPTPFASHTSSIEDLQWSPTEPTVFASCSADKSMKVWDVRVKERKSVLSVDGAHEGDVNVMSWNNKTSYLMATGGDEGGLKVWDLRNLKNNKTDNPNSVASFNWHNEPITSIEWHPTEESCFAASSADNSVTLWDLSVEQDEEERPSAAGDRSKDVPAQLLFVHQGQTDVKEVHWHPQIDGMVISTAASGFDVFKSISL